jgi:putative mycofactocin binding protein MftB
VRGLLAVTPASVVALDAQWSISPSVAIRPEPFGALAYHFGSRKLTFLKSIELLNVIRALSNADDVRSALLTAGVPSDQWTTYLAALQSLAATDMIRPREEPVDVAV